MANGGIHMSHLSLIGLQPPAQEVKQQGPCSRMSREGHGAPPGLDTRSAPCWLVRPFSLGRQVKAPRQLPVSPLRAGTWAWGILIPAACTSEWRLFL